MSRRRRGGWFNRLMLSVGDAARVVYEFVRTVILFPVNLLFEIKYLIGSSLSSGAQSNNVLDIVLHYVLLVPRLCFSAVVYGAVATFHYALSWPRLMRLRDLGFGLPALIAGIAAIVVVFLLHKSQMEIVNAYDKAAITALEEAHATTEPDVRRKALERAILYRRAGAKMIPNEEQYKLDIGRLYLEIGEIERGYAIIRSLADRNSPGYAPAHIFQAEVLMREMSSPQWFEDAVAHLTWAKIEHKNPDDVCRMLGDLYRFAYDRYKPENESVFRMTKPMLLAESEKFYSQIREPTPRDRYLLGFIHFRQGGVDQGYREMGGVAAQLQLKVDANPDDRATWGLLFEVLLNMQEYDRAKRVLIAVKNLKPEPLYDFLMARTCARHAYAIRVMKPDAYVLQYTELTTAYAAYPYEIESLTFWVRGLSGPTAEADIARQGLERLVALPGVDPSMAHFLLGFDAQRRRLPRIADEHFAKARKSTEEMVPGMLAEIAQAFMNQKTGSPEIAVGSQLSQTALQLWPDNPQVRMTRGWAELRAQNFKAAVAHLEKALEKRQNDATLHDLLAEAYQGLGNTRAAAEHRRLQASARAQAVAAPGTAATGR